jgi:hypothetical protein
LKRNPLSAKFSGDWLEFGNRRADPQAVRLNWMQLSAANGGKAQQLHREAGP